MPLPLAPSRLVNSSQWPDFASLTFGQLNEPGNHFVLAAVAAWSAAVIVAVTSGDSATTAAQLLNRADRSPLPSK